MSRLAAVTAILCIAALAPASADELRVDTCLAQVRAKPDEPDSYRCFFVAARREQLWEESVAGLEGLLSVEPDNAQALLYLGRIETDRGRPRAAELLSRAVELFERERDGEAEVNARLALANYFSGVARYDEQRIQIEQAVQRAADVDDEGLLAAALLARASYFIWSRQLTEARAVLDQIGPSLDDLNPLLRAQAHSVIAMHRWFGGQPERALEHYRVSAELYGANGDRYLEAVELYNVALTASKMVAQGRLPQQVADQAVAQTLAAAVGGRNRQAEASALMIRGQTIAAPIDERVDAVERALEIYRSTENYASACFAVRMLAGLRWERMPDDYLESLRLLDEAIRLARAIGSLEDEARALVVRAGIKHPSRSRQEIVADYSRAVERVELLRDQQPDHLVRARMFWDWAFVYYRMAGYLLDSAPSPEDVDLAYRTVEKLRARILLDAMDSAQATVVINHGNAEAEALTPILERIQELQADLRSKGLGSAERDAASGELSRLRAEEQDRRRRAAEIDSAYALMRRPQIPAIAELQKRLAADEAMLLFQLSTRRVDAKHWYWNGGSFALLVTPTRVEVVALDDEDLLEDRLTVFLGLLSRRDALENLGAASLYEDLLGPLLRQVDPSQIKRLIVVPDGTLHRLPFGALRPDPGSAPLASRYAISTVPSASLWYRQRRQGSAATRRSVLSLADPIEAPASGDEAAVVRRAELGPLPGARSEARAMTRSVGGSSRLLTGRSASERHLKAADLRKVGVLHFATHAVVDSVRPEQSAIVLAPGGDEDGLLHIREIVELELSRAIVILSACASASGELTEGEGVLGLAQAFFHAGAATVVSTQWPVRDDEAARFIHDVSAALARGGSIGAAFDEVRRDRIERGEPTASWAGFVLMGDADATLAAPSRFGRFGTLPLVAVGFLLLGIVVWFVRRSTDR